jgi:hypothetical protein
MLMNSGGGGSPPLLQSAAISAAGTSIVLTYDKALDTGSVPALGAFTFLGAALATLTGVPSILGQTVTLSLARTVADIETGLTLSYTPGASPIQDLAGRDAAALVNQALTNGSTVPAPLAAYGANLAQWHNGANVTLNGPTAVASMTDLSGNGLTSVQATGVAQPLYTALDATIDNQPSVTADGTNDVLTSALTVDLAIHDFYICFLFKQAGVWTSGDQLTAGPGLPARVQQGSGVSPMMSQGAAGTANINGGAPIGTWVRGEALFSLTAGLSYLKLGATTVQTGNPGIGNRSSSAIFALVSSLFGNFGLAEIYFVKKAAGSGGPTVAERNLAANTYLQGKYPSAVF